MLDNNEILAKTNTSLVDHTKMVLNMGMEIASKWFYNCPENFKERLTLALILHDIGKCSTSFQTYIKKCGIDSEGLENGEKTKWYYHNTLSWAFAVSCFKGLRKSKYSSITSSVLYHHIVRDNTEDTALNIIRKFIDKDYDAYRNMCEFYTLMVDYANTAFDINLNDNDDYCRINDIDDFQGEHTAIEDEKLYEKIELNNIKTREYLEKYSFGSVIRAILIYCDREISSGRFDNQKILDNNVDYINSIFISHRSATLCEPDYSAYDKTRLNVQDATVREIMRCGINTNILQASAGFGKTLMGLIWFFKNREKILWVLPRNIIGNSTYNSIVSELKTMGVNDKVRVGLYYTGKVQDCNYCNPEECKLEDCDILILNIDSLLSFYSKNNIANLLIDHFSKNMVIDEYHEMVSDAPLFSAYCNMLYTRMHYTNTKTLLLSATAVPINNLIFGNETNIKYWSLPIYGGETKVNIHFIDKGDLARLELKNNTFVILSTIKDAQLMYRLIPGKSDRLLLHSRYLPQDRKEKEDLLYSMYGKHSKDNDNKIPVIATSVIGVGLDVSANTIYDECISPEDTIQRCCGRGSRFGEYEVIDYYVITNKKENRRHINSVYNTSLHDKWIGLLREYDGKQITKEFLYKLYEKFYTDNKKEYDRYLNSQYNLSSTALSEIKLKRGSDYSDDKEITIANGMTYRGSNTNIFVTVKKDDEYIEPIIVDTYLLEDETDSNENNKRRYEYLLNKFDKSGKYILRNGFGIRKHYDASAKNCAKLAYTSNTPLLLCDYAYTKERGLEFIGES